MEKTYEHKATILGGPNFSYHHFLKHFKPERASHWSLNHVRVIFNGAEPISTSLLNRFLDTLAPYGLGRNVMILGYGLAEASVGATSGLLGEEFQTIVVDRSSLVVGQAIRELDAGQSNSVPFADLGYPFDDCQVRLVADDGNPVGDTVVGHIQIRGKNVTRGYYNNPETTREVMTEDGWLNTGDLGFMRGGRLVVTGRAKDIIFVYGKNYYAHDIEQIAQEVEKVEVNDVAACGSFNRELNKDEIILFVRYRGAIDSFIPLAQKLKRHINQRIGVELDHSIPVKRIPKTTSGKIQRYALRDQYEAGHFQALLEEIRSKQQTFERQKPILLPETEIEKAILPLAEVIGYAATCDAAHVAAADAEGAGAARCMTLAMQRAKVTPLDVSYINAHSTGTLAGDLSETLAIKQALGIHAQHVPISSTKSMTGHLLGAVGALEAVICVQALRHGFIPPTINLQRPDPDCDLDYTPNQARRADLQVVLSNSFGFGGHNATLVFSVFRL
jgi:hypothetical protein